MYNKTSEKFNTLITKPGRTFRARLLIGDEVLEGISSVKLSGGSNNGDALTLGSTISQMATITMENPGISLSGKEFTLQIGPKIDDDIEYVPMGVFVTDKIEVKADKLSITAYDRMMKLSSGYISDLPEETDTVSILCEMAQKSGVPISVEGLTAISMAKPIGYTYREVLMYVSQLYGGFANVNREGTVEIHFWEDSGYVLDADMGINGFTAGDSYTVNKITCATGQDEEGNTTSISAGAGSGIGISNPFMTQENLDKIYSQIKGFSYDTVTCPVILGDPRLDPWDLLTIQSAARTTHKVPAMSLEYAYDGGLNMTITSTISSESEESFDYKGPMQQFEERITSKIAIVESLTAKKASIEDLEAVTARIDKITSTDITTEYLEANCVDIGMANIDKAWVETLLVKGDFLVDTIHGVNGSFSKDLTGVNIAGDVIVANTLKADSLILQGDDGIYRRLNIDSLGELTVDSNPIYNEKIDGSVLVAQSVTATQIDVADLFAQKITATDLHIIGDSTFGGVLNGATGKFSGKVYCDNGIYMKYSELDSVEHDSAYGLVAKYGTYAEGTALYLGSEDIVLSLGGERTMIESRSFDIYAENTYFGGSVKFSDKIVLSANNIKIYATSTSGSTYNQLNPCNSSNQLTLGYGLYEAGIGSSNIYGNTINFYTKNSQVNFNGNRLLSSHVNCTFGHVRLGSGIIQLYSSYSDALNNNNRKAYIYANNDNGNLTLGNSGGGSTYFNGSEYYYFDAQAVFENKRIKCLPTYENTNSYATNVYVGTTGLFTRTTNTSSRTIKHDIAPIMDETIDPERLYDVTVYQFKYNPDIITDTQDARYLKNLPGFIIEELVEQYPIAVDRPTDNVKEWSWNGQYLIPPMLKLIQDQHEVDEAHEERLAELEQKVEYLSGQSEMVVNMLQELYMQLCGSSKLGTAL